MDIFSVLVVIAVMAIAVFKQKNGNKEKKPVVRPVKKQVISSSSAEEEIEEKIQMPPVSKPRLRMQRPVLQKSEEKKEPEVSCPIPESQRQYGEEVSLRTPADARRAFIYAEIFDRKYD